MDPGAVARTRASQVLVGTAEWLSRTDPQNRLVPSALSSAPHCCEPERWTKNQTGGAGHGWKYV